jgi:hypothetical protein
MSFFKVNINTVRKSSTVFFIIMIISWALMLIFTPFGASEAEAGRGAAIPGGLLAIIYAAAFISPFVTAMYSWFLVFNREVEDSHIFGLVSATIASVLSIFVIIWAIN